MYGGIPLLSEKSRAWLASVEHLPPDQVQNQAVTAAQTGLIPFGDAIAIKGMADRISQSAAPPPQTTVMQDMTQKVQMALSGQQPQQPPMPQPQVMQPGMAPGAPPQEMMQQQPQPQDAGIASIPTPDSMFQAPKGMAGGGIVSFSGGGETDNGWGYLNAGVPEWLRKLRDSEVDWGSVAAAASTGMGPSAGVGPSPADFAGVASRSAYPGLGVTLPPMARRQPAAAAPTPPLDYEILSDEEGPNGLDAIGVPNAMFAGLGSRAGITAGFGGGGPRVTPELRNAYKMYNDEAARALPTDDEALAELQARDAKAGAGETRRAMQAALEQRRAGLDSRGAEQDRLLRALSGFQMAQAASEGDTFLGAAAKGLGNYAQGKAALNEKLELARDNLQDKEFALRQAQEDFQLNQTDRAHARVVEAQAKRDAARQQLVAIAGQFQQIETARAQIASQDRATASQAALANRQFAMDGVKQLQYAMYMEGMKLENMRSRGAPIQQINAQQERIKRLQQQLVGMSGSMAAVDQRDRAAWDKTYGPVLMGLKRQAENTELPIEERQEAARQARELEAQRPGADSTGGSGGVTFDMSGGWSS